MTYNMVAENGNISEILTSKLSANEYAQNEKTLDELLVDPSKVPVLFIPATASDADAPAMENILKVLSKYQSLELIVGIDAAQNEEEFNKVRDRIKEYLPNAYVINNNSEAMRQIYKRTAMLIAERYEKIAKDMLLKDPERAKQLITFAEKIKEGKFCKEEDWLKGKREYLPPGKGRNVFGCIAVKKFLEERGMISKGKHMAWLDSDIKTFAEPFFSRLIRPPIEDSSIDLTKSYFKRIGLDQDNKRRMFGRVRRLFVAPLIRALNRITEENKDANGLIRYLLGIKYHLSGEVVLSDKLLQNYETPLGWDLEIKTLIQFYDKNKKHCWKMKQTNLGEYDHKHDFSVEGKLPEKYISMAGEIGASMFEALKNYGVDIYSKEFKDTMKELYSSAIREIIDKRYKPAAEENECQYNPDNEYRDSLTLRDEGIKRAYQYLEEKGGTTLSGPRWTQSRIQENIQKITDTIIESEPFSGGFFNVGLEKFKTGERPTGAK